MLIMPESEPKYSSNGRSSTLFCYFCSPKGPYWTFIEYFIYNISWSIWPPLYLSIVLQARLGGGGLGFPTSVNHCGHVEYSEPCSRSPP